MRHGRAKAGRKTLKFYSIHALLNAPYKVLLDGNFLAASIKQKVPIFERLEKLLGTKQFTVHVTRSALNELAALPGEIFSSARQFGLDECEIIEPDQTSHLKDNKKKGNDSKSPSDDIINLVSENNTRGYLVATQDEDLSNKLREMVNVPQMRLVRSVLILESPSAASRRYSLSNERAKQSTGGGLMTKEERELVQKMKLKHRDEVRKKQEEGSVPIDRKKKKAKGPNPLSCKKRKLDEHQNPGEVKKRSRRRKGKVETLESI